MATTCPNHLSRGSVEVRIVVGIDANITSTMSLGKKNGLDCRLSKSFLIYKGDFHLI